jgi:hypothetical protein
MEATGTVPVRVCRILVSSTLCPKHFRGRQYRQPVREPSDMFENNSNEWRYTVPRASGTCKHVGLGMGDWVSRKLTETSL